ncbi:MAG: hypothetical protein AAGH17_02620, partial [Pseudomonadota bacterium]
FALPNYFDLFRDDLWWDENLDVAVFQDGDAIRILGASIAELDWEDQVIMASLFFSDGYDDITISGEALELLSGFIETTDPLGSTIVIDAVLSFDNNPGNDFDFRVTNLQTMTITSLFDDGTLGVEGSVTLHHMNETQVTLLDGDAELIFSATGTQGFNGEIVIAHFKTGRATFQTFGGTTYTGDLISQGGAVNIDARGTWTGDISLSESDMEDRINLLGAFTGNIDMSDGQNILLVYDTLTGTIEGGEDSDRIEVFYINTFTQGNIQGDISTFEGNDRVFLNATTYMVGDIRTGDDDDIVDIEFYPFFSRPSLEGDIHLGDGNDLLFLSGIMDGDIYAGAGDDDITIDFGGTPNTTLDMVTVDLGDGENDFIALPSLIAFEVIGGSDNDFILGSKGDDIIRPGGGTQNLVTGGDGEDQFIFTEAGMTVISDFDLLSEALRIEGMTDDFAVYNFLIENDKGGFDRLPGNACEGRHNGNAQLVNVIAQESGTSVRFSVEAADGFSLSAFGSPDVIVFLSSTDLQDVDFGLFTFA